MRSCSKKAWSVSGNIPTIAPPRMARACAGCRIRGAHDLHEDTMTLADRITNTRLAAAALIVTFLAPLAAQRQTQQDEYTEYALLAPETASFKILYDVSSTTVGATTFFNPIRKGSVASDESVFDLMTG